MFRKAVDKLVNASIHNVMSVVSRPVSARISNEASSIQANHMRRRRTNKLARFASTLPPSKSQETKRPGSSGSTNKSKSKTSQWVWSSDQKTQQSGVNTFSSASAKPPCGESKKPDPRSVGTKNSSGEPKKPTTLCGETKNSNPCNQSQPASPSKTEIPCGESTAQANCCHHKDLVPPSSVLCQLKTFELRSDCTTFHLKSCGFDK